MGGRGATGKRGDGIARRIDLSAEIEAILPADTARAWQVLAPHIPEPVYLGGGTAVAVHLGHRESRDLDFFCHQKGFDLAALAKTISGLGDFAVSLQQDDTLRGLFGATKLEAFVAPSIKQLRDPVEVAGLRVASLEDLFAMKLKVLGERGEMRDYFDVMTIDEHSPLTVEQGVELWMERYEVDPSSFLPQQLYLAMGHLDDVEEDAALPIEKAELAAWWKRRQAKVLRDSRRYR